ncbi:MAG: hypothetical protein K5931_07345 [Lachnospiraceae bacterium]|nr:hypothetical protein [Lachnospiraceae bacterium]
MGDMVKTISGFLMLTVSVSVISIYLNSRNQLKDKDARYKISLYVKCYVVFLVASMVLDGSTSDTYLEDVAFQLVWFSFVSMLAIIISTTAYLLKQYDLFISNIVAFFCYFGLGTMVLEIIVGRYDIVRNSSGVFFLSGFRSFGFRWIYFIVIFVFMGIILWLLLRFRSEHKKKWEMQVFYNAAFASLVAFVSLIAELILESREIFIPVFRLCLLINLIFLKRGLVILRRNEPELEDFADYMNIGKRIPVYITDALFKVIYTNEDARIYDSLYSVETVGHKIDEFMYIDKTEKDQLTEGSDSGQELELSAVYISSDRKVNLNIKRQNDTAGELLYNIITCYNVETI